MSAEMHWQKSSHSRAMSDAECGDSAIPRYVGVSFYFLNGL